MSDFIKKLFLLMQENKNKIYMILAQVFYLGVGYSVQILLSKVLLEETIFRNFQFSNFLTNTFNLFFAFAIPLILSRAVAVIEPAKHLFEVVTSLIGLAISIGGQALILIIISTILFLTGGISTTVFYIVLISILQMFSFALMNSSHMYLIGTKKMPSFVLAYSISMILKSIAIIVTSTLSKDINIILLSIIIAQLGAAFIGYYLAKIKYRPLILSKIKIRVRYYIKETVDLIFTNIVLFGITNLAVVLTYAKTSNAIAQYNMYTLIQPWALIPFYIVSSLGTLYMVDFAKKKGSFKQIIKVMKKMLVLALLLSVASLILATIFFVLMYPYNLNKALLLLLLTLPSSIIISLLNILLYIIQGLGQLHILRREILLLLSIYIIITVILPSITSIVIFSSIMYFIFLVVIMFKYKKYYG